MSERFKDRVAAITGGAGGIGLEIGARIVREGGTAFLLDLDVVRAEAAADRIGGKAFGLAGDVSDENSINRAMQAAFESFGRIDILVNSAGITGPNVLMEDYPVDAWRQVMEVNLTGTFLACKAVVPLMRGADYGRIVNIASVAGKEGNPLASAYSASKAAVIGLTKSLGKELAKTGIRVNAVTPAAVKTEIFDQMTEEHIAFMLSKIPIGRFGLVEEVAALVCWLASEECSFSTASVFDVSGGRATY
ncbi:SDR family oxidoreductase [Mesorhizobium microcysteis]|uniref:SDR family oxidoreductase n=1 Tax=Neoaquamicrobium microcysteis TaxID=2682781 RepID=A0A5D4GQ57_9HYPH|nr:SDR family NAD(P)-dependent oxidoreductase [Mesorhizobium microcysteis]TYR30083.1 SDR family oxidoreductase [Mesorhizobium microcysteis]